MRYELVVIVDPKVEEKEAQRYLTDILVKEGFLIEESQAWGKRQLAYPVKKQTEGQYFSYFLGENSGDKLKAFSNRLTLDNKILRHLILKIKKSQPKTSSKKGDSAFGPGPSLV